MPVYLNIYLFVYFSEGESCNHVVAFLYQIQHWSLTRIKEIPAEKSCTSRPQKWHKPRGEKITPQPLMKLTFAKATTDRQQRKRDPVLCRLYDARAKKARGMITKEKMDRVADVLKARSRNIPFSYMLEDKSNNIKESLFGDVHDNSPLSYQLQDYHTMSYQFEAYLPLPIMNQNGDNIILFPDLPTKIGEPTIRITEDVFSKDITNFIQSLTLDMQRCNELESLTVTQSDNPLWFKSREKRVTSSKFGEILKRKSVPSNAFLKNMFISKDLRGVRSVAHGIEKESFARKVYVKKMKKHNHDITVYHSGLVVNPAFPYFGASPDGKVVDKNASDMFGLLEIKCPFKYRNVLPSEAVGNADFCLELIAGRPRLKRNHEYHYQIQGQMAIAGISWCDFVAFTNKGIFVERVPFSKDFWVREMFPKLTEFYFNHAVQHLILKDKSVDVLSEPVASTSVQ